MDYSLQGSGAFNNLHQSRGQQQQHHQQQQDLDNRK